MKQPHVLYCKIIRDAGYLAGTPHKAKNRTVCYKRKRKLKKKIVLETFHLNKYTSTSTIVSDELRETGVSSYCCLEFIRPLPCHMLWAIHNIMLTEFLLNHRRLAWHKQQR